MIIRPIITILSFTRQIILIVASWLILPLRKPLGPRIVRKLWSNTCERTQSEQKEQAEDSSYPEGIEVLLMEAARKSHPDSENPDNPMIAPRDHGNRTWSTQGHGTNDISLESRVEPQGDASTESMLNPIEGRPPTGKSVAEIINLFCEWSFRERWNRNGTMLS